MKMTTSILGAFAATLLAGAACAASSEDRTSMPSSCSDRDANCVIQDGAPRRRGGEQTTTTTPPSTSGSSSSSAAKSSADKGKGSGDSGSR